MKNIIKYVLIACLIVGAVYGTNFAVNEFGLINGVEYIELKLDHVKTEYQKGEEFNSNGLVVYAIRKDNSKKDVTLNSTVDFSKFRSNNAGSHLISVKHDSFLEYYTVTVSDPNNNNPGDDETPGGDTEENIVVNQAYIDSLMNNLFLNIKTNKRFALVSTTSDISINSVYSLNLSKAEEIYLVSKDIVFSLNYLLANVYRLEEEHQKDMQTLYPTTLQQERDEALDFITYYSDFNSFVISVEEHYSNETILGELVRRLKPIEIVLSYAINNSTTIATKASDGSVTITYNYTQLDQFASFTIRVDNSKMTFTGNFDGSISHQYIVY